MKSYMILVVALIGVSVSAVAKERPNIILCMSDDQGWGDTGYNGHPHLKTPHLDKMSSEGVTFTRFYAAAAMCSPTRGSCLTGRNPYRFGITFAMKGMLEASEIPITTVLRKQGYTTGHFGKWHLGTLTRTKGDQNRWGAFSNDPVRYYCPPWERDVDEYFVTESKVPTWDPMIDPGDTAGIKSASAKKKKAADRGKPFGNDYFSGPGKIASDNLEGDDSRVIMDRAIPFIRKAVNQDKPFFAVIWFHTPHSPVVGGEKYNAMYPDHPDHEQQYYACLTAMDEQVGRLRTELKELGIEDNTMLWFCSDNGPSRQLATPACGSTGGLSGAKLSISEGGIRVPGLLVWPDKVKQPLTVEAPCVTSDYFPTILDALGIPLPTDRTYDGTSLIPFIAGNQTTREKPIGFLNKEGKESAWMNDRYKLLITKRGEQLFDIKADPAEKNDLSATLPEIQTRMKKELDVWKSGVMNELKTVK